MARKFLYLIAGAIVLVIVVLVLLRIYAEELTDMAYVPTTEFKAQPELPQNVYADPAMWISRPGLGVKDPALWHPQGFTEENDKALGAAVFFVHPTSYMGQEHWNAPIDEQVSRARAELFVKGMASPFNRSADIWAPRYRQAALGAFLVDRPEAVKALDAAYGDVLKSFDFFISTVAKDRPIVLAGHSQGSFHLRRLIGDRIAGTPLANRIAAAYVVGWPVSLVHDLPSMDLPPCTASDQPGCIMSWLTVAEPADNNLMLQKFAHQKGLDGQELQDGPFLCSNPLTGTADGGAEASANLGTLIPDLEKGDGRLVAGTIPARCGEDGFLSIGTAPKLDLGPYVIPVNNYHIYDIVLFWANLRADVSRRVEAWKAKP
ncbi:MAG: DUF3089 domain-containing protein [Novosphingobium sp.]|nr:DUF3089 domain-containing protein [Novosphingobium sp.]